MKSFIRPAVENAFAVLDIPAVRLADADASQVRGTLNQRFGDGSSPTLHWNHLRDYVAVQHPDSWRWIAEFVPAEPVYFLFDAQDERAVYQLPSGRSVVEVLDECPGFEFYVADENTTYLLAHNDHDYLFGAGTAAPWVATLEPRHLAWAAQIRGR